MLQSVQHFHEVVHGVQDYAIYLLDADGRILTWNAGAERIKGYRDTEIVGEHFSRFFVVDASAAGGPARALDVARSTGRFQSEGWCVRKDGSRFWADTVVTALRDATGAVHGFVKITRDLTAERHAEETARRLLREEIARETADASLAALERAHREEKRHRRQLEVTLASIGDAVIVTDAEGAVTFMNQVAEDLTGWGCEAAVGRPLDQVFRIVQERTRQPAENPVDRVRREGVTVGLANHTLLLARDGREFAIDDSAAPIRGDDGDGGILGVVLVFRDVTELRHATEARLRLAAIVESSDDAIIGKTLDGTITSWNRGAERLYGWRADEAVGKPIAMLVPDDRADELPGIMQRLGRGERIEHFETVRRCRDGRQVDVSVSISPIEREDGEIIGASAIARDITARKRDEAAMRFLDVASQMLAELADVPSTLQKVAGLAVPHVADWCAVDLLRADGKLDRVAVSHVDPAKVRLVHELHRRHPPDPGEPYGVWRILRTGEPCLLPEIPDLPEDLRGDEFVRAVRELGLRSYIGVPLTTRGRTIGAVTFVTADSGRRFDPADLRLAEEVARRAGVAIENARLYAELKDAERQKDEFLAMLAHELRNPLAPIRNALEVMRMPGVDAMAVERAQQITERQVEHLVRLVDDLLDVSRIMRGRIMLRKAFIDLADVIERSVETAQPIVEARGQQLIVAVTAGAIPLEGDPVRLTQVLANLLNNAAKFSPRAGRIWLTAERHGEDAVLSVRDEGAGIRAELLPHVFDLFVQEDGSLERARGGLGIGLTVARQLVELHGGTITARSDGPGKGTEFIVRLPGSREGAVPSPSGADAPVALRPRRVLVVDDNVDAAESAALLLRLSGHEVRIAHNGSDALSMAEVYAPEVVLLDIGLPGLNGLEVARRLRARPMSKDVVLIAVTGYGQEDDRRRSLEAGFDHHLTKPVDPIALHELLCAATTPAKRA